MDPTANLPQVQVGPIVPRWPKRCFYQAPRLTIADYGQ